MEHRRRAVRYSDVGWSLALVALILLVSSREAACFSSDQSDSPRLVVVLYPQNNDGSPGNSLVNQSIRATFATSAERVEVYNEYLDVTRPRESDVHQLQREYLRRKYAGRRVDLVIAGLSPALDFMLANREIFPGAPIVFCSVDYRELQSRKLPPDVVGVPLNFDLRETLALGLRLHPETRHVFVIAGGAPMDVAWANEAQKAFKDYEPRLSIKYLTDWAMDDLIGTVSRLPERSLIYYLHAFRDSTGRTLIPAQVVEDVAKRANAPIYGHVDSYIGRGIVGGRVFSWEREGRNAATLGLRILAGERPEKISVQPASQNSDKFDSRQLKRWGISESVLPAGSLIEFREPNFWNLYKWHFLAGVAVISVQTALIVGLLFQRTNRKLAEERFRQAVDAAPNGMLMIDGNGTIVLANVRMEKLFGYLKTELIGQRAEMLLTDLFHAEHARSRALLFGSPEASDLSVSRELLGRRKDGTKFPVEIGLSSLRTDAGRFVLASMVDITERREAEEGLRTSQRQLRQLSGRLIGAQESERRRIAGELHDDFNQTLALLSVELDMLRQRLPEPADELRPQIDDLSARAKQLSSSIHELSHELHPLKLEQLGLVAALRGLCNEISASHAIRVELTEGGMPESLSPEKALCLYRVVQESLRNVIKHSGATKASIVLKGSENEICMDIIDRGVGFDDSADGDKQGLGLISMRERLRLVGGRLAIKTGRSCGTRIEVHVPLDPTFSPSTELPRQAGSLAL